MRFKFVRLWLRLLIILIDLKMKNKIYKFGLALSLLVLVGCGASPEDEVTDTQASEIIPPEVAAIIENNGTQEIEADATEALSYAQLEADNVIMEQAKGELKIELCEGIKTEQLKLDCNDIVKYRLVTGFKSEDCQGILNKDLEKLCNTKLEEVKQQRSNNELFAKAAADKNPDTCEKISEPSDRDDCLMQLAFSEKDPQICERFEDKVSKLDCLEQL